MAELFKSKAFIAMLVSSVCMPLLAYLNGQMDLKQGIITAISGIVSGILGVLSPQPLKKDVLTLPSDK